MCHISVSHVLKHSVKIWTFLSIDLIINTVYSKLRYLCFHAQMKFQSLFHVYTNIATMQHIPIMRELKKHATLEWYFLVVICHNVVLFVQTVHTELSACNWIVVVVVITVFSKLRTWLTILLVHCLHVCVCTPATSLSTLHLFINVNSLEHAILTIETCSE